MIIHHYHTRSGKDVIAKYIDSLPVDEQTDAWDVINEMRQGNFDKIFFRPWQKKVYEVYFKNHHRIFYIIADGSNIYLLHACKKQKNKTETRDKQIVIKRAKELGRILHQKFI